MPGLRVWTGLAAVSAHRNRSDDMTSANPATSPNRDLIGSDQSFRRGSYATREAKWEIGIRDPPREAFIAQLPAILDDIQSQLFQRARWKSWL